MKLVIDIPEDYYKAIKEIPVEQSTADMMIIRNGTPLDKIRAEIYRQHKWVSQAGYNAYNVDIAFDAVKAVITEGSGNE